MTKPKDETPARAAAKHVLGFLLPYFIPLVIVFSLLLKIGVALFGKDRMKTWLAKVGVTISFPT